MRMAQRLHNGAAALLNAITERFVGSIRREPFDGPLIINPRHEVRSTPVGVVIERLSVITVHNPWPAAQFRACRDMQRPNRRAR
jgi:hypothetical protein